MAWRPSSRPKPVEQPVMNQTGVSVAMDEHSLHAIEISTGGADKTVINVLHDDTAELKKFFNIERVN